MEEEKIGAHRDPLPYELPSSKRIRYEQHESTKESDDHLLYSKKEWKASVETESDYESSDKASVETESDYESSTSVCSGDEPDVEWKASVETESDYESSTSVCSYDEPDVFTSTGEIKTSVIEDADGFGEMTKFGDILIKHEGIVQILEDFIRPLALVSESTITTRALQLFDRMKNVWRNQRLLVVLQTTGYGLPTITTHSIASRWILAEFIMRKIKSRPSHEDIYEYHDKGAMMRNGLSILIGYWSNEDMIRLVLELGGPSLLTLLKGEDIEEEGSENEMSACSPIEDLRQDLSIKQLADQLLNIPEAVASVKKLLISLQADVASGKLLYCNYFLVQCHCALRFWFTPSIVMELIKALKQSEPLVKVFKKYSKRAQVLRCEEKFTRIQRDPLLGSVLENDDPVSKMRGMLSILFGYCYDRDVCKFFRCIRASKVSVKEDDDVEVVEYVAYGPDDVQGLKKVLAEKYSKDSEKCTLMFDKIMKFIEMEKAKADMGDGSDLERRQNNVKEMLAQNFSIDSKEYMDRFNRIMKILEPKKAEREVGFDLALVIVLVINGNVMSRKVVTEF